MTQFHKRPPVVQREIDDGLIAKLVEYPQEVWDFLKEKKALFVPEGRFSPKYFAKNLLPFTFVEEISQGARKKLCIALLKSMIEFDSTMARNFRDTVYTEEDRETFADIAAIMDETQRQKEGSELVEKIRE